LIGKEVTVPSAGAVHLRSIHWNRRSSRQQPYL
jgi:hypothetical protein